MPAPDQLVVLVIEDDPLVCILLQDILHEEGYQVLLAENGEQAMVMLPGRAHLNFRHNTLYSQ